jgi:hypothetical protein
MGSEERDEPRNQRQEAVLFPRLPGGVVPIRAAMRVRALGEPGPRSGVREAGIDAAVYQLGLECRKMRKAISGLLPTRELAGARVRKDIR